MGNDNFQNYFQGVYGDRWVSLYKALLLPEEQVARWNEFVSEVRPPDAPLPGKEIPRSTTGLLKYYVMDPASILAAQALDVQPGDSVLDMCAAPGGKALILAEQLWAKGDRDRGELMANELSATRRDRLKKVIQQYIPREARNLLWVTGQDGGLFAVKSKEKFDRILLDAPCSGERHLLQNSKELSQWTPSRSKKLAQRQYALLTAALEAVKVGGRIVYSTCSISPNENDGVIEQLLDRKPGRFEVLCLAPRTPGEKTKFGWQYFPDRAGIGPIYFCAIQRLS